MTGKVKFFYFCMIKHLPFAKSFDKKSYKTNQEILKNKNPNLTSLTSQTSPTCPTCQTFANKDLDHLVGHNVGANLMFALEQMSYANECSRANTRFAPTMWSRQRSHLAETMIKVQISNLFFEHSIAMKHKQTEK